MQVRSTKHGRLSGAFLLAAAIQILCACSTQEPKVYHVGILIGLDHLAATADGFKAGMSDLGYVEGKNIVYDVHRLNFDLEAGRRILGQLVSNKVDAILALPTEVAIDAKEAVQGNEYSRGFLPDQH